MRSLLWFGLVLACASPAATRAQACLGSSEYAAPAAFVSAHVGRLSTVDSEFSLRPIAQGLTLRGMLGGIVGVARAERAEGVLYPSPSARENREFSNYEISLIWNFSPDDAWGMRLCPQLGYGRRLQENRTRRFGEPLYVDGSRIQRWFVGFGAALPFALGARWSTAPVLSWRRETVNVVWFGQGAADVRRTPRPFNALSASLGLAYVETITLVLEYEVFLGTRLETPTQHGVGEPGARNVRLVVGYHLPSRTRTRD